MRLAILAAMFLTVTLHGAPSWTPQTSGVTARLRGVSAVNDRIVWASGAGGTVLRTTDGGAQWLKLTVPADAAALDFRDIDAIGDRTAYALSIGNGPASRIYKTTDAGVTWTLQFTNTDEKAFFDAMAFWDADRGVAFSDSVDNRFIVLTTGNGGRSWELVDQKRLPPALAGEGRVRGERNQRCGQRDRARVDSDLERPRAALDGSRPFVERDDGPTRDGRERGPVFDRVPRSLARPGRRRRLSQGG